MHRSVKPETSGSGRRDWKPSCQNRLLMRHTQSQTAIVVSGLCKSFRSMAGNEIEVLRDVSLTVAAGEMVAIMGVSGAGKSTLLHLLGGLENADAGSIELNGFSVNRASSAQLARFRNEMVGFVFQSPHLLPDLNTLENVRMPLLMNRLSSHESSRRAALALERVGLSERALHQVGQLSGGEQQRVAIARALINEPRLVLADEPTGNLDATTGDETGALLASYCRTQQAAVIVATHNERLAQICDRALRLQNGSLEF
jgi:lipoprotein-releasing system ATP-binding protein